MKRFVILRTSSFICLFILLAVNYSCSPSRAKSTDYDKVLDNENVVMLDTWVTQQLALQKEWVEDKNGFMEANIILRNLGGKLLHLEIRTYFKDSHGGTVETASDTWNPVTVNPHEDFHYSKLCTKKEGAGYQFHIRLGKLKR
ncbi:MAG: DUF1425 domain-containing protein [Candidatus Krumholzibacteria bacterium]|nr:DUF1425 domain-containing protein [Candidatus Krumholzibacteria bacterium]